MLTNIKLAYDHDRAAEVREWAKELAFHTGTIKLPNIILTTADLEDWQEKHGIGEELQDAIDLIENHLQQEVIDGMD